MVGLVRLDGKVEVGGVRLGGWVCMMFDPEEMNVLDGMV